MQKKTAYVNDLARLIRKPSDELLLLERAWPAVKRRIAQKRSRLIASIPSDDPIHSAIDLLQPLKCVSDETLHTQALCFALNPGESHGFGKNVLLSLISHVAKVHAGQGAARVLRSLRKIGTRITVHPEYRYRVEGSKNRLIARSDIWIESHSRKRSAAIVIENKIGASESEGQLAWYEHKAERWCRAQGHDRYLLIYLTPKGAQPRTSKSRRWVSMSYLELAAALRTAWRSNKKAPGTEWLAMYITAITRGVLGIDPKRKQGMTIENIEGYLGRPT